MVPAVPHLFSNYIFYLYLSSQCFSLSRLVCAVLPVPFLITFKNGKKLAGGNYIIIDHLLTEMMIMQPLIPLKVFKNRRDHKTRPYTTTYSEFLKFTQSDLC